jgi:acylphosphatase
MKERRRIVVRGRVQAVGFRWFVRDSAEALRLDGWVRNLPDGRSVEAVAQGPRAQLDRLVEAMRMGPPGSHVSECQHSSEPPEDIPEGFHIGP